MDTYSEAHFLRCGVAASWGSVLLCVTGEEAARLAVFGRCGRLPVFCTAGGRCRRGRDERAVVVDRRNWAEEADPVVRAIVYGVRTAVLGVIGDGGANGSRDRGMVSPAAEDERRWQFEIDQAEKLKIANEEHKQQLERLRQQLLNDMRQTQRHTLMIILVAIFTLLVLFSKLYLRRIVEDVVRERRPYRRLFNDGRLGRGRARRRSS